MSLIIRYSDFDDFSHINEDAETVQKMNDLRVKAKESSLAAREQKEKLDKMESDPSVSDDQLKLERLMLKKFKLSLEQHNTEIEILKLQNQDGGGES